MKDRYHIISTLASGGSGSVQQAWDNSKSRDVAIKRLKGEGAHKEYLLREARSLYALRHPHIVTIYEYDSDEEGAYLVMELIKGESLEKRLSRGPLSIPEFKILVNQTLDAIGSAHEVGLIHRDLKPENIMLPWSPTGAFEVKVIDFGLSQNLPPQGGPQDSMVGSIHFMAPEQFGSGHVDVRTDLYALGCIYYYALTGQYPFPGEQKHQVITAHLYPPKMPLIELRPDLSDELCGWVDKLMSVQPGYRPATAMAALAIFRRLGDNLQVKTASGVIEPDIMVLEEEEMPAVLVQDDEDEELATVLAASDEEEEEGTLLQAVDADDDDGAAAPVYDSEPEAEAEEDAVVLSAADDESETEVEADTPSPVYETEVEAEPEDAGELLAAAPAYEPEPEPEPEPEMEAPALVEDAAPEPEAEPEPPAPAPAPQPAAPVAAASRPQLPLPPPPASVRPQPAAVAPAPVATPPPVRATPPPFTSSAPPPPPPPPAQPVYPSTPEPLPAAAAPVRRAPASHSSSHPRPKNSGGIQMIVTAFVLVLLAQFALVSYSKYAGREAREQRLAQLASGEDSQGSDVDVRMLLDFLADPTQQERATQALTKLQGGTYIDEILHEHLEKVKNLPVCARLIRVIGQRRSPMAFPTLVSLTADSRGEVRQAAWTALSRITPADKLPQVLAQVRSANSRDKEAVEKALVTAIETAMDRPAATQHTLQAYQKASDHAESRTILFNVLTRVGGSDTLAIVTDAISDPSPRLRLAAITVLAEYPTHEPLAAITSRFPNETDEQCRTYLLLAARELIGSPGPSSQQTLFLHAQSLYANAKDTVEKRYVLSVLSRIISPGTANFFDKFAESADASLKEEAQELAEAFREKLEQVVVVKPGGQATLPADKADYRLASTMALEKDVLINWTQEGDWASWLVELPHNGEYEIALYQSHNNDQLGTYEVLMAGQTLLNPVVQTKGLKDFKGFVMGTVKVEQPGIYRLRVRAKTLPAEGELFRVQRLVVKAL